MFEKGNKKKIFIMIAVVLAVILLVILGFKLYAKKQISLSIDEKTYYVHQRMNFDIPQATASDQDDEVIDIEITIYKDGKKVANIDTNRVGDIYKVYYKASKGLLSVKKYITVKIIANENLLKYEIAGISNEWTNQDVTLIFVPTDNNIKEYCFDGKCTSSKEVKVSKNGTYKTYIIDEYGNKSEEKTYKITNIDKIVPSIKEVSEYTNNGKIYLGVTANDDASGVKEYSFDNGKTYSEESTIRVTKDTTVKVKVKDTAGNESEVFTYNYVLEENTLKNDNLDNEMPVDSTAPTFTLTKQPGGEWSSSNVVVTVNATDDISGVKEYSFDNGSTWQTSNTKEYTSSANIKVRVKDNSGNISTAKDLAIKIDKVAPVITNIVDETTYTEAVTFEVIEDNIDTQVLRKDGSEIAFITTIDENGSYSIIITDKAGNSTSRIFAINIETNPDSGTLLITGVEDGKFYNINVTPGVSGGSTLTKTELTKKSDYLEDINGVKTLVTYEMGDSISEEGTYTLYVKDENNNSDQVTFVIDKTNPEVLSELSTTSDDTILTARDYSLDTVILYKDDVVDECFSIEAATKGGKTCVVTDYYNMIIYKMLEYDFEADTEAEYQVKAKDKAGNETTYNVGSDIIPIYSIGDLEAIGSNTMRTINNKEYFMSSASSYRLMNDLDYDNNKYNQISTGEINNDLGEYYTIEWTMETEKLAYFDEYKLNNLEYATIQDENSGEIDHLEVTINGITYVNLGVTEADSLFYGGLEFNKIKIDDDYVDLVNPVRIMCVDAMSESGGIICNVETDSTKEIPLTLINIAFGSDFYEIESSSEEEIVYAIFYPEYDEETEEFSFMTFYFKVNAINGSLIGIFVFDGDNYIDITIDLLGGEEAIPFVRLYERNINGDNYLIWLIQFTTQMITVKENKQIMIPKDDLTTDGNYIYFTYDGVQYRVEETEWSDYYEFLTTKGYDYFDAYHVWYCSVACEEAENWTRLAPTANRSYMHIELYAKQNWLFKICYKLDDDNGLYCGEKYYGYGYGDGDLIQNNIYVDKYKRYIIIKYNNEWYKIEYPNEYGYGTRITIFNKITNKWENEDTNMSVLYRLNYPFYSNYPTLSITFDGNNKKISNLTNSSTGTTSGSNQTGLFKDLYYGTIKNLTIDNAKLYDVFYEVPAHVGILANEVTISTIKNVRIENSNIYPDANEHSVADNPNFMGALVGSVYESQILNNVISGTVVNEKVSTDTAVTKMGGLISHTRNSNIIGNNIDIINNFENASGLAYSMYVHTQTGGDYSNVYNSYVSDNIIKYRNKAGIIFNQMYTELFEQDLNYKVHFSNNTFDIADIE